MRLSGAKREFPGEISCSSGRIGERRILYQLGYATRAELALNRNATIRVRASLLTTRPHV